MWDLHNLLRRKEVSRCRHLHGLLTTGLSVWNEAASTQTLLRCLPTTVRTCARLQNSIAWSYERNKCRCEGYASCAGCDYDTDSKSSNSSEAEHSVSGSFWTRFWRIFIFGLFAEPVLVRIAWHVMFSITQVFLAMPWCHEKVPLKTCSLMVMYMTNKHMSSRKLFHNGRKRSYVHCTSCAKGQTWFWLALFQPTTFKLPNHSHVSIPFHPYRYRLTKVFEHNFFEIVWWFVSSLCFEHCFLDFACLWCIIRERNWQALGSGWPRWEISQSVYKCGTQRTHHHHGDLAQW